ncbi:MAG: hypothetical protein ACLSHL_09410 [Alistipes communis]
MINMPLIIPISAECGLPGFRAWVSVISSLKNSRVSIQTISALPELISTILLRRHALFVHGFAIQLFDAFRNIPIWTDFSKSLPKDIKQAPPTETFRFIEKELLECLDPIEQKQSLGSQSNVQGRWTKAGVAALLVRLYLNAEAWIGEDRYDDCAKYAQRILDGEYGPYKVEDRWDAVFDWNNDTSDEMILASIVGRIYLLGLSAETHWCTVPHNSNKYFGDIKCKAGTHNSQFACSPSYDLYGKLYNYELGMTVNKFRKLPRRLPNGKISQSRQQQARRHVRLWLS